MLNVRLASDHLYEKNAVHQAVAGDVYGGVFCAVLFPTGFSYLLNKTETAIALF